jgi:hypothetical protein
MLQSVPLRIWQSMSCLTRPSNAIRGKKGGGTCVVEGVLELRVQTGREFMRMVGYSCAAAWSRVFPLAPYLGQG